MALAGLRMLHQTPPPIAADDGIASYEVSEDGVTWRPFNPATDKALRLHRRIQFAPLEDDPHPTPQGARTDLEGARSPTEALR
ncbi:MAG: hypothetical protein JNM59_05415 [Hyphomonadaceae bacterium]|nr:hypothetical protein [Hyphomonadaceae bacterium]